MSSMECEICLKSFFKRSNYKRHLSKVHGLSEEDIQAYLDRAGDDPQFQCPDCNFVGSVNNKAVHMQSCKGKELQRPASSVSSSNEAPEPKVPKLATSCKDCGKSYSNKYKLRDHCKNVHGVDINLEDFAGPKKKCPNCHEPQDNILKHLEVCLVVPQLVEAGSSGGPRATATSAKAREVADIPAKVSKRSFRVSKDMADPFLHWLVQKGFAKYTVSAYMCALEQLLDHFDQDVFSVSSFQSCFQQFEAFFSQLNTPSERNTIFKAIFQFRDFLKEMFDFQLKIPATPSMAKVIANYFSSKDRKFGYEGLHQSQIGQIQAANESQLIQFHDFVLAEVLLFTKSEDFVKSFTNVDFQKISNQTSNHLFKFGSNGFTFPDSLYEIMKVYADMVRPKLLKGKWSPNDTHKFFSVAYRDNLVFCSIEGAIKCIGEISGHPFPLQLNKLLEVECSFTSIEEVEEEPLDMSIDPDLFPDGASNASFADMEVVDSQSTAEVEAEAVPVQLVSQASEGKKSVLKKTSKKAKVKRTSTGKSIEENLWIFGPQDHRILTIVQKECMLKKVSKRLVMTYFVLEQTDENKGFLELKKQASGLEMEELYEVMAYYINKNLI